MSSFVEPRLLPAVRKEHWTRPDEQVGYRLADARLERREFRGLTTTKEWLL